MMGPGPLAVRGDGGSDAGETGEVMLEAFAGGGEQVAQQVIVNDPSHDLLHGLIRIVPGGALTILMVVGWAFRQRIRGWVVKIVRDVLKKGDGT